MKILQLVNRIPYPLNDGGNLAVNFYLEGFLKAGVDLSMLAMNTTRHWVEPTKLPSIFQQLNYFETVKIDNRIKPIPAFLNLIEGKSYNITRFISKDFDRALTTLLTQNDFDIIQLEGLFLTPYIPTIRAHSKALIVLRQHNVEHLIWHRLAEGETNFFRKKYLQSLTKKLKEFEVAQLNKVDLLIPISQTDADSFKFLGAKVPIFTQPFGLEITAQTPQKLNLNPISLYHIGALDWLPNQEAIRFFLNQVFPLVLKELPDLKFHLAGRNIPIEFQNLKQKNVVIHGEVPDAAAFEKDKTILVVPLLSGGGVRIKIFKAMGEGKVVVSTRIGIEGIDATPGKEAIIADTPKEMALAIINLVKSPQKIEEMGKAAFHFIKTHYNRPQMITELLDFYTQHLDKKNN